MKIAVDFQSVRTEKTGIGVFAERLLKAVEEQAQDIELLPYEPREKKDLGTLRRLFWENIELPSRIRRDKPDVLYLPGFSVPLSCRVPKVIMVHDLIGMIQPENLSLGARFYWSRWLPWSLRFAEKIVVNSESTRKDLNRLLGFKPQTIEVISPAADTLFGRIDDKRKVDHDLRRMGVHGKYILSVGTLEYRKNYSSLIRAFEKCLRNGFSDVKLIIVGKDGGEKFRIEHLVSSLGLENKVRLMGYVSDQDLNILYNGALGYALVSRYEGFGIPALEAMSCHLGGVLANNSALPEVAGPAAIYTHPDKVTDIAGRLSELLKDSSLRQRLSQEALKRSKLFSWRQSAQKLIEIFRTCC